MELKRLEVFGFKSFADRTRFEFDSGITVIVGPNGCGKSNVVDAVKWVLGEQSPKSLRGREMADIIFAGSESRRSLGFAEATLTFDNSSGTLPIDVAEVEVSRRLYRSGESEYLLNRKPCRLRDVRELFMDTGIGLDAYSLIEQGKVDVLLQSNPHERRLIFEEAAGISKYKAKRKEAERKLARTEQNLLRLGDILDEVERRLRSVKYQAGKARNYKQYTARLKELRVSYALNQYHEHSAALAAQQTDINALQNERAARSAHLAQFDQQRSALEAELMDLDGRVRDVDSRLSEIRSGLATHENEIGFHRTRVDELRQIVGRDRRKIGNLSAHLREADAAVEARRTEMADVAMAARDQEVTVASIEQRLRDLTDQVRNLTGRIEHAKMAMLDLAQERTRRASRQAGLDASLETLGGQAGKLHARRDEIATSLEQIARQQEALRREGETLKRAVADRRGRLETKRREAEARQRQAEQVGEQFARAKEQASALDSRRELLDDLERRGEGIPAAVRKVADAIRTGGASERWRGMVADLIEVDVTHAVVIESALGPAEKLLVADRQADVLDLARRIEGQLSGQVRFLALDAIQPVSDGHDLSACPEAVGWAMDYVRAAESVRPAIEHLLARTVVVRTLDGAAELARGPLRGYRFVSLSGSVLEADGSVAVGPPGPETSLISRRSELLAIRRRQEDLNARIERLDGQRCRAVEALAALDDAQQELRQEIYEASMRKVEVEGRLRRLAETRRQLQTERPVLENELEDLARQHREAIAARDATAREIADIEQREAAQQATVAGLVAEQDGLAGRRDACEQDRTGAHVMLAQLREKHAALVDALAAARRDLDATRSGIEEGRTELAQCQQRVRQSQQTMLRLQSELATLFMDKETAEAEGRRLASDRAERREAISALSRDARTIEGEIDELQQRIHERELQRRELQTKRDDLVSRVRDDFGMDLAERYAQWQAEQVDWDAVAEEIHELQTKIERLGAVNLEAIDEQEALEHRTTFLQKQNDDLTAAREALGGLIDRINRESRQRFMTTFDAVREHFQELFRKLFGGGKADVFLEDEQDVLEAGIEVVARPPGKQLQRISLLSGGEKTMTAVALLLAIFRARPSPFAILDEVDAALDESNVDRFTDLVKEFLDQSQFVIISHNKRTMAIADVLYGVTMQEPGVSRKVSVKFSDLHEHGYVDQESDRPESEPDKLPVETEAALSAAGARAARETDEAAEAGIPDPDEMPEEEPAPEIAAESPVVN
ncbi:MAG TPA: chromosome segregation protein SMC [Phycisphaerae bacterium]|nr:chromosome segregation protein SMC [Phycisphaerae bacterium]